MVPAHFRVPTWPRRTSGYSGVSKPDSLSEALLEVIREFLEGIPATELTVVFERWIDRVR
jgi:hypothetical protein